MPFLIIGSLLHNQFVANILYNKRKNESVNYQKGAKA